MLKFKPEIMKLLNKIGETLENETKVSVTVSKEREGRIYTTITPTRVLVIKN